MTSLAKIASWRARPLTEAAKNAKFRMMMDQRAERELLAHAAIKAGWIIGGTGVACFAASIFGWVTVLNAWPQPEPLFYTVDKTSGYIGPATTVNQAPKLFPEASDHEYLERYMTARERWVPDTDQSDDYLVKLMSRRDEQERYAAWRRLPSSPMINIGKKGHIDVHNFRYHRLPFAGKDDITHRYLVQFERTTWRDSTSNVKGWSATVDFQWHPELSMRGSDRDLNSGGFQVINYSAEPDN